jgi:hypothetical protein
MPGDPGATVVTNARAFYTPRAAAGATGTRHSPRPLWAEDTCTTRARRAAGTQSRVWLPVRRFILEARRRCRCSRDERNLCFPGPKAKVKAKAMKGGPIPDAATVTVANAH